MTNPPMNYKADIQPFEGVGSYQDEDGWIAWRHGTGGNMELLHITASRTGEGRGRRLLQKLLIALGPDAIKRPWLSVFGFTKEDNKMACRFYEKSGFDLTTVKGVYPEGTAVLFSQTYKTLRDILMDRELF